jgi:hypothetical protein
MNNSNLFTKDELISFKGNTFELYENNNVINNKSNNLNGNLSKNNLTELYYSQSNINLLQDSIIKGIYNNPETYRHKISKQNEDQLLIIMRSIYLQYCKNQPNNIQQQIHDLNKFVLDYSIPNIITAIKQYKGYFNDITKTKEVINMPIYVSTKGDKSLMPRHFI